MLQQRLMWILWPAFLVAGVLEVGIFAMFDPQDMHWFGQPIEASRQTVYTLSFFALWGGDGLRQRFDMLAWHVAFRGQPLPLAGQRPARWLSQAGLRSHRLISATRRFAG